MISAVALMASFASCNKMEQGNNPAEAPSVDGTTTITVSATVPQTKVIFDGTNALKWSSGDMVTLFGENGTSQTSSAPETAATSNFTFTDWPTSDTPKYLVYNGSLSDNVGEGNLQNGQSVRPPVFENGKVTMTVRANQQITNNNSFGKHANLSIGALENGEDGGYTTVMKNVCGVIKFSFANNAKLKVYNVLIRNVDQSQSPAPMVGMVQVDYNNGEPTAEVIEGTGVTQVLVKAKVTDEADFFDNKSYYACVLPGTYEPEITLNYNVAGVEPVTLKAKDGAKIEIKRSEIFDFGTIDNIKVPDQPGTGEGEGDDPVDPTEPITLTLDFSTSWPFNESLTKGEQIQKITTYTLTQNGKTYSFDIFSESGQAGGGFYFNGSALRLTNSSNADDPTKDKGQKGYISVPAIPDYKLSGIEITVTNLSGTKSAMLYSGCTVSDGKIDVSGKIDDTMSVVTGTGTTGSWNVKGTSVNTQYYLYTSSNNYQLGKLVLTYTK